jgi:hypothetical protein
MPGSRGGVCWINGEAGNNGSIDNNNSKVISQYLANNFFILMIT